MPNFYAGGFRTGFDLFAVDGDFTFLDPCGPPIISFPFEGDSIFSKRDVVFYAADGTNPTGVIYTRRPLGTNPNFQPWAPNGANVVLEQDFTVAYEFWRTPKLNSQYTPAWAIGFSDPLVNLTALYLVKVGELRDCGGGIAQVRLRFAALPYTRNVLEKFAYSFPGFDVPQDPTSPLIRQRFVKNVPSRIQYDYFIFDDDEVLPLIPVWPNGPRLNATTGVEPVGIILEEQRYMSESFFVLVDTINDADVSSGTTATTPTLSQYLSFATPPSAEIIVEGSTLRQWMGNIYERRTRYVLAE
jgi:hypothetical protein